MAAGGVSHEEQGGAPSQHLASRSVAKATTPPGGAGATDKLAKPELGGLAGRAEEAFPAVKFDEVTVPRISGAKLAEMAVEVTHGTELTIEPPNAVLGEDTALLTIKSYTRAAVYIDGQFSGLTPRTVKLLAGEHTVTLLAEGYEDWTRKLKLRGRQQAGILASMSRRSDGAQ
jgi:hypothetical protein